jgi:uncharacterized membrane protein YphA (DoxX/SURF4 family)
MIPVLKGVLEHCAVPMAVAVAYGEFLIGLSLVIGVLSRLASIFGIALMNRNVAVRWLPWRARSVLDVLGASLNWSVFTLCFVVLALSRPEEVWSLRQIGHRYRKASSPQIGRPTWVP